MSDELDPLKSELAFLNYLEEVASALSDARHYMGDYLFEKYDYNGLLAKTRLMRAVVRRFNLPEVGDGGEDTSE